MNPDKSRLLMPRLLALPLACLLCVTVTGCGNKGDLYLANSEALEQSLDDVDQRLQELSDPGSASVDDALDDIEAEEAAEEAASDEASGETSDEQDARKREQTRKTR